MASKLLKGSCDVTALNTLANASDEMRLVVLVVADVRDVVPTGRVVALETLFHARVLLAGNLLRDHREVLHEMARRRLVALHAHLGLG